jgi:stage III sporulation protein AA
MNFHFLPQELQNALKCININFLSEIRIRSGQPVIIEYKGEYTYINSCGVTHNKMSAISVCNAGKILSDAMCGSVYAFTEQLKRGFVTVDGGVRIGVCGEYVCEGGRVSCVKAVTSLNIRVPHNVIGCSAQIYNALFSEHINNTLVFSPPGYGKTTILRDLAKKISSNYKYNVLIFDERNEISAFDGNGFAFDVGERVDVVRGGDKLSSFENAIRAMKPQVIITDELYGEGDIKAIRFAVSCGIKAIASSHITARDELKKLPFDYFAELTGIGKRAIIYDKNFVVIDGNNFDDSARLSYVDG